jgi:hypothetical protein
LFVEFQKALAPAMSDGNRNPEGFRTEECSPPGRGAFTPDAVPIRRKKKERKQMRTQQGNSLGKERQRQRTAQHPVQR